MKKLLTFFLLFMLTSAFNCALAKEKIDDQNNTKLQYVNVEFWQNFNDELLLKNIYDVFQNNTDLKVTSSKLLEAKRIVKMSLADELPHIGFNGYVGQIFKSSDEVFGNITIPDYTETRFLMPLTLSYEIDIWGKNHLKTASQKKRLEMMKQDERSVYIALTSAFAIDYYNLIKIDELIDLQKKLVNAQMDVCNAIKKRYEAGTATVNDIIYAEKSLTYLKEELNQLEEKQDVLKNQMNVLLADKYFADINRIKYEKLNFKTFIPNEINPAILEKRPDWQKSQFDLQRIGIDVKIAKRELLPKFNLVGNIGFNAYNLSSANTFLANLGVYPSLDLFMGGKKIQYLKLQKDEYEIALRHYDKVILTSIKETNDALYLLKSNDKKYKIVNDRLILDNKDFYLLNKRMNIGTADNLDMLMKKEQLLISKKQETSLKINNIISMINLYQALGGINFFSTSIEVL